MFGVCRWTVDNEHLTNEGIFDRFTGTNWQLSTEYRQEQEANKQASTFASRRNTSVEETNLAG